MKKLRIAIADDHQLYTEALATLLAASGDPEISIAGTVGNGFELLEFLKKQVVDLILLDLNMPGSGGLDVLPEIKLEYPNVKIIVITMYDNAKFIKQVLNKYRADGYFLKSNRFNELLQAIKAVMDDEIYLSKGLKVFPKEVVVNGSKQFEDEFILRHRLTPRETQIIRLVSHAKSNKEIAGELYISDQTVMVHRKNIMRKLNLSNTASLIKFAIDHDLSRP